jgi:hypothetical protein
MAVLVVYEAQGDPKQLKAQYDVAGKHMIKAAGDRATHAEQGLAPLPDGTIAHFAVPTDSGLRVYLLMVSEDYARKLTKGGGGEGKAARAANLVTDTRTLEVHPVAAFSVHEQAFRKSVSVARARNGGGGTAAW